VSPSPSSSLPPLLPWSQRPWCPSSSAWPRPGAASPLPSCPPWLGAAPSRSHGAAVPRVAMAGGALPRPWHAVPAARRAVPQRSPACPAWLARALRGSPVPCATRPRALRGSSMHGRRPCTVVRGPRAFLACPCAARCPDVLRAAPVQLSCVSFVELHQCPRSTTTCFYPSSTARRSSLSSPVSARSALKSRVSFARAMRVVHTCRRALSLELFHMYHT
jgi:hypothetical protein